MKLFLLGVMWILSSGLLAYQRPCTCKPNESTVDVDCNWYIDSEEAAWLPTGYAEAATCACTLKGLEGAHSPTANCVRQIVQDSHKDETYFSAEQKQLLLDAKNRMGYRELLNAMQFSAVVHELHQKAYAECCCPGMPAERWAWDLITLFGKLSAKVCSLEIRAIEEFGPCGCDGW